MAKRDPKPSKLPPPNPKPGQPKSRKSEEPIRFNLDAPSRSAELRCPIDNAEMEKLTIEDVIVDRCTCCGALWFDVPELSQILNLKGAAAEIDKPRRGGSSKSQSGAILLCPRDHTEMKVRTDPLQQHISMHRCPMCLGILLRGGDLLDLSEFTLKERIASFFST